ncbi:MAG: endonuclease III domain-containing protein, partial [Thermoanaerobaculum sp.]
MSWAEEDLTWLLTTVQGAGRGLSATTLAHVEKTRDPFRLLVACVISLRTKDQVTAQAAARLFAVAPDVCSLAQLPPERIAELIYPAGFYRTKARQLHKLAHILLAKWNGQVPKSREGLMSLPGVGRKTANLVLGLGFGIPAICVDTHVHRIANRLGLVQTRRPEETEAALERVLPQEWWIPFND